MKFSIRKANIKSARTAALILRMQKETLPLDEPYNPIKGVWFIAYTENGDPAGYAGVVQSSQWWDTAYLCRAGVLYKYRGNGLQKRLIKTRIRAAKTMGFNWLITDTSDNAPSANSLISAGFRMYEPSKPYALNSSLYWRLKLKEVA